jgi:hypothetical protein
MRLAEPGTREILTIHQRIAVMKIKKIEARRLRTRKRSTNSTRRVAAEETSVQLARFRLGPISSGSIETLPSRSFLRDPAVVREVIKPFAPPADRTKASSVLNHVSCPVDARFSAPVSSPS